MFKVRIVGKKRVVAPHVCMYERIASKTEGSMSMRH